MPYCDIDHVMLRYIVRNIESLSPNEGSEKGDRTNKPMFNHFEVTNTCVFLPQIPLFGSPSGDCAALFPPQGEKQTSIQTQNGTLRLETNSC